MNIYHIIRILLEMLNEMSPYILLGFLFAGILHAFVKPEVLTQHLAGNGFKQSFKAALLGVPLPLCSCGVLPTAISLKRSGASTSATTSFLIATPQTGVDSIAATYSLLGIGFAIVRPIAALISAILGGTIMGRLTNEVLIAQTDDKLSGSALRPTLIGKVRDMLRYGFVDMVGSVGKWLVIGLVIAALITAIVPNDFFAAFAQYPLLAMIVIVMVAIPMYVCATGSIPIALSLMLKGITLGTALVFLMAGPAVNFASYTLLSRSLGKRNTLLYIAIIALSAITTGLIIDYLLPRAWFVHKLDYARDCCMQSTSILNTVSSVILVALLVYALIVKRFKSTNKQNVMAKQYRINGMMCVHCKARVEKELATLPGVSSVKVDLEKKLAYVEGNPSDTNIADKVNALGYEYVGIK
jgi:uncharacterized membrane protein YraQ (UPF0718 family)/copper chaperone CopZ